MTPAQSAAISARGNVLLEAGAGAGKTSTLVARCLALILAEKSPVALDEILMVTFTEAAAAEMRKRIRAELNVRAAAEPANPRLADQLALLDQARIGTLHGFCFRLVREHFHELGLDPQSGVLDEGEVRLLAGETAAELLDRHFAADPAGTGPVLALVSRYGEGEAAAIEELLIRFHQYLETLPDPAGWLAREEQAWREFDPRVWEDDLNELFQAASSDWLELLDAQPAENKVARECACLLRAVAPPAGREEITHITTAIAAFREDRHWNQDKVRHRNPIMRVLDEAALVASFAAGAGTPEDPLRLDFECMQPHVLALINLVREFGRDYALRKRQRAALDFSDLEQFALRLLWAVGSDTPTPAALGWRARLKAVLVDEYQDINEVQDRIIAALSREGEAANRFLVGDVKQSIYGFRLARPDIFLRYAREWRVPGADGRVLPLADNFRSHEAILAFINHCFGVLLREDLGGTGYPAETHLRFGDPAGRAPLTRAHDPRPRVEMHLLWRPVRGGATGVDSEADGVGAEEELTGVERQAVMLTGRLRQLHAEGFLVFDRELKALRAVRWSDMAILLRAAAGKAEVYARIFARSGIPLVTEQPGFFEAQEISDLVSLLLLLDNPRQDIPLLAVLRSPLAGLSPDELVAIRVSAPAERSFWVALNRYQQVAATGPGATARKTRRFLDSFDRWRGLSRRGSLSHCLEDILDVTQYPAWLANQPRGGQQAENVQRLLELARRYDSWQGRGLHRFLSYVRLLEADGEGPASAPVPATDAVRLMTIHAGKGLEFPVVALPGLERPFRKDAPCAGFFIDEALGICPEVGWDDQNQFHPSLRMLLAQRKREQLVLAEEIRLLYVAMTRACDRLILVGTAAENRARKQWMEAGTAQPGRLPFAQARTTLDLIGPLLTGMSQPADWLDTAAGAADLFQWNIHSSASSLDQEREPASKGERTVASWDPAKVASVVARVTLPYPQADATRQTAKTTVTRVGRQLGGQVDEESGTLYAPPVRPQRRGERPRLSAAEAGSAHHLFLQRFSLDAAGSEARIAAEADRLLDRGDLTVDQRRALQLDRIHAFWDAPVGRAIRDRGLEVQREFEFTCAFSAGELAVLGGQGGASSSADELVVVQGIVDLAVIGPREIWLLDYKTDHVGSGEVAERLERYRPQVELYRRALTRIYGRPVTRAWLHFLHPGITLDVPAWGP